MTDFEKLETTEECEVCKLNSTPKQKKVTVYSKPNCQQCNFTKQFLTENNVEFTAIDVTEDDKARAYLEELGFQSLPVVEIEGEEPFFGFRPDRLQAIA